MTLNESTSPIPHRAPETSELIRFLKDRPVGSLITYEELSAEIRKDVTNGARSYLQSARRYLNANHGQFWEVVRGEGIKLLNPNEAARHVDAERKSAARKVNRIRDRTGRIPFDSLDDEGKRIHNGLAVGTSIARMVLGKKGQDKLRANLPTAANEKLPDATRALDLFKK